jgi:hypothetical protein
LVLEPQRYQTPRPISNRLGTAVRRLSADRSNLRAGLQREARDRPGTRGRPLRRPLPRLLRPAASRAAFGPGP